MQTKEKRKRITMYLDQKWQQYCKDRIEYEDPGLTSDAILDEELEFGEPLREWCKAGFSPEEAFGWMGQLSADSPLEAARVIESLVMEESLTYDVFCVEDDEHNYVSVDLCEEEDDACSMPATVSQGIREIADWIKNYQ